MPDSDSNVEKKKKKSDLKPTIIPYHPSWSPVASGKFPIKYYIPSPFLFLNPLQQYSSDAHALGIEVRWWGAARQPRLVRILLWSLMKRTGSDWINADDLYDVARFLTSWDEKVGK